MANVTIIAIGGGGGAGNSAGGGGGSTAVGTGSINAMTIETLLENKVAKDRANIKSEEIAKVNFIGTHTEQQYGLVVQSLAKIEGGVEIFARAWKDGKQLGFGADGSIDIERFRIFNPPILVDDPNGTIVRTRTDALTGKIKTRTLREDPVEAIRQSLIQTVKLVGKDGANIIAGKIGNTVSTFYSSTNDGRVYRYVTDATWSACRDGTDGTGVTTADASERGCFSDFGVEAASKYSNIRAFFDFDTSVISTDAISAAVFSISKTTADITNANTSSVEVVQTTHALPPVLASYNDLTFTSGGTKTIATFGAGYNDITLDATGRGFINKTGTTKIGIITGRDLSNSAPTGMNDIQHFYFADQAGTTNDPKLVVTHAAAAATSGKNFPTLTLLGVG